MFFQFPIWNQTGVIPKGDGLKLKYQGILESSAIKRFITKVRGEERVGSTMDLGKLPKDK